MFVEISNVSNSIEVPIQGKPSLAIHNYNNIFVKIKKKSDYFVSRV